MGGKTQYAAKGELVQTLLQKEHNAVEIFLVFFFYFAVVVSMLFLSMPRAGSKSMCFHFALMFHMLPLHPPPLPLKTKGG